MIVMIARVLEALVMREQGHGHIRKQKTPRSGQDPTSSLKVVKQDVQETTKDTDPEEPIKQNPELPQESKIVETTETEKIDESKVAEHFPNYGSTGHSRSKIKLASHRKSE